jgi:hypothetical protein
MLYSQFEASFRFSRSKRFGFPARLCPLRGPVRSGMFGPPFRPPYFVGGTSGIHDGPLIGRTECPGEAGQRGLDKPRFEGHPCSLAVRIEFPGHSQRLQRRCDAPGGHTHQHDGADPAWACALPFSGLLNHGQGFTGRGAVAFNGPSGAKRSIVSGRISALE